MKDIFLMFIILVQNGGLVSDAIVAQLLETTIMEIFASNQSESKSKSGHFRIYYYRLVNNSNRLVDNLISSLCFVSHINLQRE